MEEKIKRKFRKRKCPVCKKRVNYLHKCSGLTKQKKRELKKNGNERN